MKQTHRRSQLFGHGYERVNDLSNVATCTTELIFYEHTVRIANLRNDYIFYQIISISFTYATEKFICMRL